MPIRTAPRFCLGGRGRFDKLLYGCRDPSLSMCRALGLFLTSKQCVVETGQMSSAETGQMSAVETADICSFPAADICPVSRTDSVCVRNMPRSRHINSDGSRQPYSNFSNRPHPPRQNRGAVLMGIAVWRVTERPPKNCNGVNMSDNGQGPASEKWSELGPEWSPGAEKEALRFWSA